MFPTQAYPAERPVTIIEQFRPHNVLDIGWPDETVFLIYSVPGNFLYTGIVDGFHKRVSVVEKVSAASHKLLDYLEMTMQGLIDQRAEPVHIMRKKFRTLGKGNAGRTVTTFIDGMTGSLVTQQIDPDRLRLGILQQVYYIAMISDRNRFSCLHSLLRHTECFCFIFDHMLNPTLRMAGLDAGTVHFCNDTGSTGYNGLFRLCPTHSSETGGDKEMPAQILILRNA